MLGEAAEQPPPLNFVDCLPLKPVVFWQVTQENTPFTSSLLLFVSVGPCDVSVSILVSRANLFHVRRVLFDGVGDVGDRKSVV